MSNAVQTTVQAKRDIRDFIQSDVVKEQMAMALPKHITADRMTRVALTAIMRTPKLFDCTRESLLNALLTCSQAGLEPDGRNAHLIPYNCKVKYRDEKGAERERWEMHVQVIFDYKGLVELAMRSGVVANIHADVVCDNDTFEYDLGQLKAHKIDFRKSRGDVYAVYSLVRFKDGTEKCEVMTREEVEGIRKRSKSPDSGPWKTDWNEMAKKTVFRRLSKWITLSPEFRDVVDKDDDTLAIEPPQPVKPLFPELPNVSPTTVLLEPAPTMENANETASAEKVPAATYNYVKALNGLCNMSAISEDEVIGFAVGKGFIEETLLSFEDVAKGSPAALKQIHDGWSDIAARIKESRLKSEAL